MLTKYKSLALLLTLFALTATACDDGNGEAGCRPLDSDHDGLVHKCLEEPAYDAGGPPANPPKDAGNQTMDAGRDDDAGQD
jgi:hypothetical protein